MHNNWILNPFLYVLMQHNEDYVIAAVFGGYFYIINRMFSIYLSIFVFAKYIFYYYIIEEHIPRIKELLDAERNIELKHNGLVKKKERGYER